jgi:hypothetical protein
LVDIGPAFDLGGDLADPAGGDQQSTVTGHARARVFQAKFEGAREIALGNVEFLVGDSVADKLRQFGPHE